MTEVEFKKIMADENLSNLSAYDDDNAILGLNIIRKYLPKRGIDGAEHDMIYSVTIDEIVKAGISEEDATELRRLNWHLEEGYCLACFV